MFTFSVADSIAVGAVVVGLVELFKFAGVPQRFGLLLAAVLSTGMVPLYAWSRLGCQFLRPDWWELVAGVASVLFTAAGVYGFIRNVRPGDVTSGQPKV